MIFNLEYHVQKFESTPPAAVASFFPNPSQSDKWKICGKSVRQLPHYRLPHEVAAHKNVFRHQLETSCCAIWPRGTSLNAFISSQADIHIRTSNICLSFKLAYSASADSIKTI